MQPCLSTAFSSEVALLLFVEAENDVRQAIS